MAKTIQIQKVKSRKVDLDHYEVNYANMVAHFCPGEQRGWSAAAINKFLVANAQKLRLNTTTLLAEVREQMLAEQLRKIEPIVQKAVEAERKLQALFPGGLPANEPYVLLKYYLQTALVFVDMVLFTLLAVSETALNLPLFAGIGFSSPLRELLAVATLFGPTFLLDYSLHLLGGKPLIFFNQVSTLPRLSKKEGVMLNLLRPLILVCLFVGVIATGALLRAENHRFDYQSQSLALQETDENKTTIEAEQLQLTDRRAASTTALWFYGFLTFSLSIAAAITLRLLIRSVRQAIHLHPTYLAQRNGVKLRKATLLRELLEQKRNRIQNEVQDNKAKLDQLEAENMACDIAMAMALTEKSLGEPESLPAPTSTAWLSQFNVNSFNL